MSYAIIRVGKVKGYSSIRAIERHGENREHLTHRIHKELENKNRFIDPPVFKGMDLTDRVRQRIGNKKIRKDAVRMLELILTYSPEANDNIMKQQKQWIQENITFLVHKYGKENLMQLRLDMDETTPHLHAFIVPFTKDDRLSAKEVVGSQADLSHLQDEYANAMEMFDLHRGRRYKELSPAEKRYHEEQRKWWYDKTARECEEFIFSERF